MKTSGMFFYLLCFFSFGLLGADVQKTNSSRNMLIIACHPDDWELGMGGTAFLLRDKFQIHVAIASDGELGNTWNTTGKPDPQLGALRVEHSAKSAEKIHAKNHYFQMRDGGVYADEAAVGRLVALLKETDPAIIFLHWPIDKADHAAAAAMALMALSKAGLTYRREIYFFEVGKLDHFAPAIYVNVTPVWEVKTELVKIHERFNDDRFRRMAEESASHHGFSNHCKYAEGFIPLLPLSNRAGCSLLGL